MFVCCFVCTNINILLQAPFQSSACAGCDGVLVRDMGVLAEQRFSWIVEICQLTYTLIRHLATDYRKNQEVL